MPKREDEFWAGMKEPKGRGLCPFCGSSNVYYNKRYKSWKCAKCEKSFPTPSYGPGGDFGKEARWFGKTTEEIKRKEFAEAARKARTVKFKKSAGSGFSMKKTFLVLLVIACLVAAIYTGYLLFTRQTDPVVGTIILLADIGVLIWNISVLRKYRVGAGTVISIFVIIAILGATIGAFAGLEPLSSAKGEVVAWFQNLGSQTSERGLPPASDTGQEKPEGHPIEPFSPSMSISPPNLCFTVNDGLNPAAQIIEMGVTKGVVTWSAIDDAQWLNLDPVSGNTDKGTAITVSVDISGMYPGEYVATATISAPDAKNTPLEVRINLLINPSISVSPAELSFMVNDGLNPSVQILEVRSNKEAVAWSAIGDAPWLNLAPVNGSTDEGTTITVSVDISGMHPGEYVATATVSAPDAKNTPLEMPVSLLITGTKETLAIKEMVGGNADNVKIDYDKQPLYSKTFGGEKIHLDNNKDATNPTWQQLITFLHADESDQEDYDLFSFPCGAFAEEVHNNAEAAGIRAAWVAVDFEDNSEGHALNAFNTIDKGLVFIDCTGQQFGLVPIVPYSPGGSRVYGDVENWDKIAYVQVGKTYGLVSLEADYGPEYPDYEQWQQDKLLFDSKGDAYMRQLGGRLSIPEDEYRDLMRQLAELDALASHLGGFWEPLGVVSKIEIYW